MDVVVRRFAAERQQRRHSLTRVPTPVAAPAGSRPASPALPLQPWPNEDCANEPVGFFACGEHHALWALGVRL